MRVTPRAPRDAIEGWKDGRLRVRLRAPPAEGRANEALRRLLAAKLGVPASSVEVASGAASRVKRVRISGLSEAEALRRLEG